MRHLGLGNPIAEMLNLESGEYLGSARKKFDAEGVLISEVEYHQRVFEGWHYHKNNHLTLILSGGNREQRKHAEIHAYPGSILIYKSGELHRNINTVHPSTNINIEIEDSFFANYSLKPALFENLTDEHPGLKLASLKVLSGMSH
jgi:AraC family transcriptional regulator